MEQYVIVNESGFRVGPYSLLDVAKSMAVQLTETDVDSQYEVKRINEVTGLDESV